MAVHDVHVIENHLKWEKWYNACSCIAKTFLSVCARFVTPSGESRERNGGRRAKIQVCVGRSLHLESQNHYIYHRERKWKKPSSVTVHLQYSLRDSRSIAGWEVAFSLQFWSSLWPTVEEKVVWPISEGHNQDMSWFGPYMYVWVTSKPNYRCSLYLLKIA